MEDRRAHIIVTGRVQGVSFRAYTESTARSLGLIGWVRNLPSGQVEIVAEGTTEAVERLVEWAHTGPSLARVENVEVDYLAPTGEPMDFSVR
jgi:acylphosphatase